MCAITGSLDKNKLKELYALNTYRGELSYSLASFRPQKDRVIFQTLFQESGKIPEGLIDSVLTQTGDFLVCHSQAPTTNSNNVHPAVYGDAMLWHNGIIKQKNILEGSWDTAWLLKNIIDYGWSSLSRIDGTFACIMYLAGDLFIFRNEISPLFLDDQFNVSSVKFEGSRSLTPNKVWKLNFETSYLDTVAYFDTFENPYYIPEAT
jgi:asparagine synthetase B (glutamine-hydrolysing)